MLLGYSPNFGRAFSRAASMIAEVLELQEVDNLSGPPEPGMPHLHRVSDAKYELLIPRRQPEAVWHHPRFPIYRRRYNNALLHLETRHGRIDVIHGHFYSSVINVLGTQRTVVVTEHSNVFGRGEGGGRPVRRSVRMARAVYRRISMALPVSYHQMSLMRQAGLDVPMMVVHNPVEPIDAPIAQTEPAAKRIRMLTACRLAPTKNLEALVEAVAVLNESEHDVSLTLLGEGPQRQVLERLAHSLGLERSVAVRGWVTPPEVRKEMAVADLYLMCSTVESFGLPVVEAIMSGLPVIATPVGIAPELSGIAPLALTGGFEPADIAETVRRVVEEFPTLEERIEAAGLVRSLFSLEATAERLLDVYESVRDRSNAGQP